MSPGPLYALTIYPQWIELPYMAPADDEKPGALLPLPPATFHILMAVADEDRHGYAIIREVAARTNGEMRLSAGTLYRSVQRMLEQGLIEETDERPAPEEDDERRRYYRITDFGTAVARAEARRLTQLVRLARASGFVPKRA
jgi:DNA-binding PadR family transcriptional regulator